LEADFADDICLLSSSFKDMESKINEFVDVASEFNLKINVNKTKEMRINILIMKKQINNTRART
jgi:CRISPR/Cas system CSM-associated protein Csm2 small subunit